MNYILSLALYGILALAQARPESGYNYQQPHTSIQLSQSQLNSALQQQLQLSQSQQSSSYQQSIPQLTQLSAPAVQYGVPNVQGSQSSQILSPELNLQQQNQYLAPNLQNQYLSPNQQQNQFLASNQQQTQFLASNQQQNQFLASNQQQNQFLASNQQQNQYLAPNQQQNQYLAPNQQQSQYFASNQQQNQLLAPSLQVSQNSLSYQNSQQSQGIFPNFDSQSSVNQVSQGLLQQHVLPQITQDSSQYSQYESQPPIITKHIYVHVAPEDSEAPAVRVVSHPSPPRKTYKIIFIKAPRSSPTEQQIVHLPAAAQPVEEKTLVYVLVDKPQQPEVIVSPPQPAHPSKPEVYFIKYKAQKTGINLIASQSGVSNAEEQKKNQGLLVNSGSSTSSLFSGGLPQPSPKYGPPGY